jgi:hypothetical protein
MCDIPKKITRIEIINGKEYISVAYYLNGKKVGNEELWKDEKVLYQTRVWLDCVIVMTIESCTGAIVDTDSQHPPS